MTSHAWSAEQEAIFEAVANGEGHLVVQARAGTGKSTTALEAVRRTRKARPRCSMLYLAFNTAIAEEFRPRVEGACDVMTTHSFGNRMVANAWGKVRPFKRAFGIARRVIGYYDRTERRWIAGTAPNANKATSETTYGISALVDHAKDGLCSTPEAVADLVLQFQLYVDPYTPEEAAAIVLGIMEETRVPNKEIDFADMIWLPSVCNLPTTKYDLVFVDEAQDLNKAQLALVQRACAKSGRIVVIGDEKQAIYAWRGADPTAMPRMRRELEAKVLPLTTTYRCPKRVVALANKYVPDLRAAETAPLGTVEDVKQSAMLDEVEPGDAILSRTNAPLVSACLSLLKQGRRAFIRGRDIGKELKSLIWRSKKKDVVGMLVWLARWRDRELQKLEDAGKGDTAKDRVTDTFDTIYALCEGLDDVSELEQRLDELFEDTGVDDDRILLSSTHRAKGMEWDTVWMLRGTYLHTWFRDGKEDPAQR